VKMKKTRYIDCGICGNTGLIHRGYAEPGLGLPQALDKVQCPRCTIRGSNA
jgi:DNA-directed RNA polymerase subunit RPC12/RpoP